MTILKLTVLFFINCFFCIITLNANAAVYSSYAHELFIKNHLSTYYTVTVLSHAKFTPQVITKITTPYEAQPFNIYVTHFVTPNRIKEGVLFWHQHQRTLLQAQKKYGVSAYMITAILGIETIYGKKQGAIPVLNSLYTLAFYYPLRARFFKMELSQYLLMCYDNKLSPYTIRGSYAGAFGMPQFMPSSYRVYSVAYNRNDAPDIAHNVNDAIFSIANYFKKMGWKPHLSYRQQLTVIRRYNGSLDYAMTAEQLAQAIKAHDYKPQL